MKLDVPDLSDIERKQIERALTRRDRYRYVRPVVRAVPEGILVESPCCSRRVDPRGGTIDVALLQRVPDGWRLYSKDHASATWKLHSRRARLTDLLDALRSDPERIFWQ